MVTGHRVRALSWGRALGQHCFIWTRCRCTPRGLWTLQTPLQAQRWVQGDLRGAAFAAEAISQVLAANVETHALCVLLCALGRLLWWELEHTTALSHSDAEAGSNVLVCFTCVHKRSRSFEK